MAKDGHHQEPTMTTPEAIAELMNQYNAARAAWVAKLCDLFDEADFHAWFTRQVTGKK
jgi:hypothetical protein